MSTPAPPHPPRLVGVERLAAIPGGPHQQHYVEIAESLIRGQTGWHIAPIVTETLVLDHIGGPTLVLPTLRVHDITSVVHRPTGAVLTGWDWSGTGVLTCRGRFPAGPRALAVTLTHGHEDTPAEIVGLVAELARALPLGAPGLRSESRTVGGILTARSYIPAGPVRSTLDAFEHVIDRYRVSTPT